MNNEDTDNDASPQASDGTPREGAPSDRRPLGYWLRTVDGLLTREFATAFDGAGVTRRDWMLLNALSGDVELPAFAERFARKGKRLRGLAERGWAEESGDGTWVLTDEGCAAKEGLGTIVDGIRSRVSGAVSPEDFGITLASLEAIARELGWEEGARMPRAGFGRGFGSGFASGFGPGFGPGNFGPGFGPGPFGGGWGRGPYRHRGSQPGFAPGDDGARDEGYGPWGAHHCHPHHEHDEHGGHHHGGHRGEGRGQRSGGSAQRAYERGFDAGFSRGRSSDRTTDGATDAA